MLSALASSTKLYDESYLKGFTILFSWDYPKDWCQKNIEDEIFHVYDLNDVLRLESQVITESIQASNYGVILSQPNIEQGSVPCELQIVSQAISNEYAISKLIIVSEAKHLELYVNDMYIKTSKGFMLTLKKGSTPSLFQSEFDIAPLTHNADKVALKFVSLPSNNSMRLQTVVILLSRMPQKSIISDKNSSTVDIKGIREMLQEMGLKIPENAENLMNEIELKQNREKSTQEVILKQMCNQGSMLQMLSSIQNNLGIDEQHSSPTFYQHQQASQSASFQGFIRQTKTSSSSRSLHSLYPISRDTVEPDLHTLTDRGSLSQRASLNEPKNSLSRSEIYSFGTVHNSTNLHISMDKESLSEKTSSYQPVKSPRREELYNGFGTPNPPQESVLANALLNEEASKVTAYSRASYIEQDNYEKSQLKLIKELLMDQSEHSKPSHFTHRPQHSQKNNRPKSLSALPSEKEADFTKMLTSLLEDSDSSKIQNRSQEQLSADRWEAYLRSRVRASQRMSNNVMTSEEAPLERDDLIRNDDQSEKVPNQPKCTLCDSNIHRAIVEHIQASENRITQLLINKIAELRCDMMSKMDNICNSIVMDKIHYSSSHYDDSDVLKSVV